jgi:hypothetical protein
VSIRLTGGESVSCAEALAAIPNAIAHPATADVFFRQAMPTPCRPDEADESWLAGVRSG